MHIAVVGSGAAGLSAAWLLSKRHRVTLLETNSRLGGHAHTATVSDLKIDTGFIVYNEPSYPNLTHWFKALGVETQASDMSFAVSRDNGSFEYAGGPALGLLAQPGLLLRPRFWRMLRDLLRFYKHAADQIPSDSTQSLGSYLHQQGYSEPFIQDHLLPFGAAIWSTSKDRMLEYPAASFIRFCDNHGLLQIANRPQWRTVKGGSERYVQAVHDSIGSDAVQTDFQVCRLERTSDHVQIHSADGRVLRADQVVLATHADQALALLDNADELEKELLSVFDYSSNLAVLHTDISYLPKRRRAWCSWNYVERGNSEGAAVSVSYWMNRLQNLNTKTTYVVSLNPETLPQENTILRKQLYEHPVFTAKTWDSQQRLWSLQGRNRTWFCGSYFGAGFHEDAVQSGFAVAEQLGSLARPWSLSDASSRIVVPAGNLPGLALVAA